MIYLARLSTNETFKIDEEDYQKIIQNIDKKLIVVKQRTFCPSFLVSITPLPDEDEVVKLPEIKFEKRNGRDVAIQIGERTESKIKNLMGAKYGNQTPRIK